MVLTAVLTGSGYPQTVALAIEGATDSRVQTYCPSAAKHCPWAAPPTHPIRFPFSRGASPELPGPERRYRAQRQHGFA